MLMIVILLLGLGPAAARGDAGGCGLQGRALLHSLLAQLRLLLLLSLPLDLRGPLGSDHGQRGLGPARRCPGSLGGLSRGRRSWRRWAVYCDSGSLLLMAWLLLLVVVVWIVGISWKMAVMGLLLLLAVLLLLLLLAGCHGSGGSRRYLCFGRLAEAL